MINVVNTFELYYEIGLIITDSVTGICDRQIYNDETEKASIKVTGIIRAASLILCALFSSLLIF